MISGLDLISFEAETCAECTDSSSETSLSPLCVPRNAITPLSSRGWLFGYACGHRTSLKCTAASETVSGTFGYRITWGYGAEKIIRCAFGSVDELNCVLPPHGDRLVTRGYRVTRLTVRALNIPSQKPELPIGGACQSRAPCALARATHDKRPARLAPASSEAKVPDV
ncbi:hypothetical protein BaRGS_00019000 [Batillaria attramentaria]|uniref:Uncharacterized protein n=1 Tax=Batillaria attramentaria TaxID=370345 RepID=A0ABD0KRC0_9CAEN